MKSLARWAVVSLLAAPLGAWALSLGEIDVRSTLNQPLAAEIALTATAEELQALTINLASAETFARYGLERPGFLSAVEFRVGTNPAGSRVIFVSSRQAIAEPFVELLVEASSRSGRLLRQYTIFLDPPTLLPAPAVPAAIEPAQTRAPEPSVAGGAISRPPERPVAPEPVRPAATPTPPTPAPAAPPRDSTGGTYGPVQNGETLWAIATRMRPSGITMNQMMVAVYQANPQAFDANMNILRRGAILRIPELGEVEAVDTRAATAEVQRHTDTWAGRSAQQEPRLILVPPTEDAVPAVAGGGSADGADAAEVADLRGDVAELESELEESRRLLEVRDAELRALQERLATAPEATGPETAPAAADPGVELESEPLFADEPPIAVEAPAVAPPAVETPVAVTPAVPSTVVAAPAEPSLVDQILGWVTTPIVWIVAGVGVVLLGLLLFLRRRSRAEPEDVTGKWEALEAELDDDVEREATARLRRQVRDEDVLVHEQPAEPEAEPPATPAKKARPAAVQPAALQPELAEQTLSSQTVINLDQADPIAEADFHMAYGLYDQAADLVTKALKEQPTRRDLRLKLLEVFFVWGNKESFLKAAKKLHEEMGARLGADWDKVVIMGKQICPDELLFAGAMAAAPEVDVDLDAGEAPALDLAFDAEEEEQAGVDLDLGGAEPDLAIAQTGSRRVASRETHLDIGERTQAASRAFSSSIKLRRKHRRISGTPWPIPRNPRRSKRRARGTTTGRPSRSRARLSKPKSRLRQRLLSVLRTRPRRSSPRRSKALLCAAGKRPRRPASSRPSSTSTISASTSRTSRTCRTISVSFRPPRTRRAIPSGDSAWRAIFSRRRASRRFCARRTRSSSTVERRSSATAMRRCWRRASTAATVRRARRCSRSRSKCRAGYRREGLDLDLDDFSAAHGGGDTVEQRTRDPSKRGYSKSRAAHRSTSTSARTCAATTSRPARKRAAPSIRRR
jgi:pilus assembly protein FimV